ncbi:MAG TPA: hypothetical protein DF774_17175 [Rheinheimera sp.]|uniref:tetratricopeptide repeat protein n=1 Tax=Rheinheimera sp. TaxID=1869214 RepID=UPI000ED69C4F|nr:hypothetical protein [Rheinheimera sp.]HCU67484.1 hypothetical protein [Rheinheimera sp.]
MKKSWLIMLCFVALPGLATDFAAELKKIQQDPTRYATELSQTNETERDASQWLKLGVAHLQLKKKDAALNALDQALKGDLSPALKLQAWQQKALVYGMLFRDNNNALQSLQQAELLLPAVPAAEKPALQASLYENFAQAYNQFGKLEQASRYAELGVEIAVRHQLPYAELKARLIAGRLALQQNNFALTQRQLSRALILAQQLDEQTSLASIHLRLGMAYRKLAQLPLSLQHLQSAETLYQQSVHQNLLVNARINLAETYLQLGEIDKSAQTLRLAMQDAEQLDDSHLIALVHYGQAQLAMKQNDYALAKQRLTKAMQLFSQLGHDTLYQELLLALAEIAIAQQEWEAAVSALPAAAELEKSADFLKIRYWELKARLYAGQQQWQSAFDASQQLLALRFDQAAMQQKYTLDLLTDDLNQQQLKQQVQQSLVQLQQKNLLIFGLGSLVLLLACALAWRHYFRRSQDVNTEPPGLPQATSWTEFARKVQKEAQKTDQLQLQALQLANPQQFKFQFGEQILRHAMLQLVDELPVSAMAAYTVHTDALWLAWRCPPAQLAALQQQLQAAVTLIRRQLPNQPTIYSFLTPLTPLLGKQWPAQELAGVRELVWLSWDLAARQQQLDQYKVEVECLQANPCSWQTEDVRADLINALRLDLLQLRCNGTTLEKPHL